MALNFKVLVQKKNMLLRLRLTGDFDGSSAFMLINAIQENISRCSHITVNTSGLRTVEIYGVDVFKANIKTVLKKNDVLHIAGKFKEQFFSN